MFSFEELLLLSVIFLVVFGPDKLPEVARALGKAAKEFRKVTYTAQRAWDEIGREMELQEAREKAGQLEEKRQAETDAGSLATSTAPANGGALSAPASGHPNGVDTAETGEKQETGDNYVSVSHGLTRSSASRPTAWPEECGVHNTPLPPHPGLRPGPKNAEYIRSGGIRADKSPITISKLQRGRKTPSEAKNSVDAEASTTPSESPPEGENG